MHTCTTCNLLLPKAAFGTYIKRDKTRGLRRKCRDCRNAQYRKNYAEQGQTWLGARARQRKYHATRGRETRLKRYGITLADFDRIITSQDGVCPICLVALASVRK